MLEWIFHIYLNSKKFFQKFISNFFQFLKHIFPLFSLFTWSSTFTLCTNNVWKIDDEFNRTINYSVKREWDWNCKVFLINFEFCGMHFLLSFRTTLYTFGTKLILVQLRKLGVISRCCGQARSQGEGIQGENFSELPIPLPGYLPCCGSHSVGVRSSSRMMRHKVGVIGHKLRRVMRFRITQIF